MAKGRLESKHTCLGGGEILVEINHQIEEGRYIWCIDLLFLVIRIFGYNTVIDFVAFELAETVSCRKNKTLISWF